MIALGLYKHYKGGIYEVYGFAKHSETQEILVLYYNIEHQTHWARPLHIFLERTYDGLERFEFIGPLRKDK